MRFAYYVPLFLFSSISTVDAALMPTFECINSPFTAIINDPDFPPNTRVTCPQLSTLSERQISLACDLYLNFHCPITCGTCDSGCLDSNTSFLIDGESNVCDDINIDKCSLPGVRETCKESCSYCETLVNVTELALLLNELSGIVDGLVHENEDVNATVGVLIHENEEIRTENEEIRTENEEIRTENEALRMRLDTTNATVGVLINQNEDLNATVGVLIDQNKDLNATVGVLNATVGVLIHENGEIRTENEALRMRLDTTNATVGVLINQNEDLNATVGALIDESEDVNAAVGVLVDQNEDLNATVGFLINENDALRTRLDTTEDRLSEVEEVILPRNWIQLGSNIIGDSGDASGYSVSMSDNGKVVAVGAQGGDKVKVYTYAEENLEWYQLGTDITGDVSGDQFGKSVSLSDDGKTIAIGGYLNDGNAFNSGHVRIYQYKDTSSDWSQIGNDIYGESVNDNSGEAVSISDDGKSVAIGATFNDGNGSSSGHTRVFTFFESSNLWLQLGGDLDGEAATDFFGGSVAMAKNGEIVAIGGISNDGNGDRSGHVRIFSLNKNADIWEQVGADIDGEASVDHSGCAVALSKEGNVIAIGAYGNDGNGSNNGHVRVYSYNEDSVEWIKMGNDIYGKNPNDYVGYYNSVSLADDGMSVAVGAPYNDGTGSNAGSVTVYSFDGMEEPWVKIGDVIYGENSNDRSSSVSLSGDGGTLAIGGYGNDDGGSNSGHVRIFKYLRE